MKAVGRSGAEQRPNTTGKGGGVDAEQGGVSESGRECDVDRSEGSDEHEAQHEQAEQLWVAEQHLECGVAPALAVVGGSASI